MPPRSRRYRANGIPQMKSEFRDRIRNVSNPNTVAPLMIWNVILFVVDLVTSSIWLHFSHWYTRGWCLIIYCMSTLSFFHTPLLYLQNVFLYCFSLRHLQTLPFESNQEAVLCFNARRRAVIAPAAVDLSVYGSNLLWIPWPRPTSVTELQLSPRESLR